MLAPQSLSLTPSSVSYIVSSVSKLYLMSRRMRAAGGSLPPATAPNYILSRVNDTSSLARASDCSLPSESYYNRRACAPSQRVAI